MYRSEERWSRAAAGLVAGGVQLALGALLIYGLAASGQQRRAGLSTLTTVDFATPPPPEPPRAHPSPSAAAPAPEARKAAPLPVEAPPAHIPLSPKPAATTAGAGADSAAGSGAQGSGPGGGGAGAGSGSGGIASPAQRIAGALRDRDYPRELEAQRVGGTVHISFRVRTDGRVAGCTVVGSSGSAVLDALTCRLFTERFRFRPAMTAGGQPVESTLGTSFTWGTRER
jgi:protein TonB